MDDKAPLDHRDYAADPAAFEARRKAAFDAIVAVPVQASAVVQAGHNILVARCPKCGVRAGIPAGDSDRHLCRGCHTILHYQH